MTARFLRFLTQIFVWTLITAPLAMAQTAEINLMAGPNQSTSLRIAQDLRETGSSCGLDISIHQSSGALDNLLAVKERRYTQFGLIQSDVLEYLRTYQPDVPDIERAMRGITVAFPLYQQEVQILASKEISSLQDLQGKRVAIGNSESGTFLTATVILDLAGLNDVVRLAENPDTALGSLVAGDIDALFFVDGAPSPLFQAGDIDPNVLHLVPIDDPILAAVYTPALIKAGTYPFLEDDISTVSVQAILLAFDYATERNRYNTLNCNAVSSVTNLVTQNLDNLRSTGHPKWTEVSPNSTFEDWPVARCVAFALSSPRTLSCD